MATIRTSKTKHHYFILTPYLDGLPYASQSYQGMSKSKKAK